MRTETDGFHRNRPLNILILEPGSQPLYSHHLAQTRFVPSSAYMHRPKRLCCCGSVSIASFNGITPSGINRSSGSFAWE